MLLNGPEELYSANFDLSRRKENPLLRVMIATIPRSGSTQLGIALWRTGSFGAPLEYLNLAMRAHDMIPRIGNGDTLQYWSALEQLRTTRNGVFSFKAFITDFSQIAKHAPALRRRVKSDSTVYLTRRDKVSQAVSWARAIQTRRWFALGKDHAPPTYSRENIESALQLIKSHEKRWEMLFDLTECPPIRLFYEDFFNTPCEAVDRLLSSLSIDRRGAETFNVPDFEIQRDNLSAQWIKRFRAEYK